MELGTLFTNNIIFQRIFAIFEEVSKAGISFNSVSFGILQVFGILSLIYFTTSPREFLTSFFRFIVNKISSMISTEHYLIVNENSLDDKNFCYKNHLVSSTKLLIQLSKELTGSDLTFTTYSFFKKGAVQDFTLAQFESKKYRGVFFPIEISLECAEKKTSYSLSNNSDNKGIYVFRIRYIKCIHDNFFNSIFEKVLHDNDNINKNNKLLITDNITKKVSHNNNILFKEREANKILYATKNFVELFNIIKEYCRTSELLNYYYPISILLNGEPGLGKTRFADYCYNQNYFESVIIIDMLMYTDIPFSKIYSLILENFETKMPKNPNLIIIDELDKYIETFIETQVSLESKNNSQAENEQNEGKKQTIKIIKPKMNSEIEQRKISLMKEFLCDLTKLVDTDNKYKCIYVYCCNNFDNILKGNEETFKSLKTRFVKFDFKQLDKSEIMNIIRFYNSKFENTPKYISDIDPIMKDIKNISVSIRTLNKIIISFGYDLLRVIDTLSNEEYKFFLD